MKITYNNLVRSCFEYVSNNANSIMGNNSERKTRYNIKLNKAIKQIEQASVLSGEEQSITDRVVVVYPLP